MALSCGVCGWALGKGDLSAPGTEPESGGAIKLSERIGRGGPWFLVKRGSASLLEPFQQDDLSIRIRHEHAKEGTL